MHKTYFSARNTHHSPSKPRLTPLFPSHISQPLLILIHMRLSPREKLSQTRTLQALALRQEKTHRKQLRFAQEAELQANRRKDDLRLLNLQLELEELLREKRKWKENLKKRRGKEGEGGVVGKLREKLVRRQEGERRLREQLAEGSFPSSPRAYNTRPRAEFVQFAGEIMHMHILGETASCSQVEAGSDFTPATAKNAFSSELDTGKDSSGQGERTHVRQGSMSPTRNKANLSLPEPAILALIEPQSARLPPNPRPKPRKSTIIATSIDEFKPVIPKNRPEKPATRRHSKGVIVSPSETSPSGLSKSLASIEPSIPPTHSKPSLPSPIKRLFSVIQSKSQGLVASRA